MPEEIMQAPIAQDDMTPDQAAASLSLATGLSEQVLRDENPDVESEEMTQETPEEGDIEGIVEKKVQEALKPIVEQIESLLAENGEEES